MLRRYTVKFSTGFEYTCLAESSVQAIQKALLVVTGPDKIDGLHNAPGFNFSVSVKLAEERT